MYAQVDLPRLKDGKQGGAFWSAFTLCPKNGTDFSDANYVEGKLAPYLETSSNFDISRARHRAEINSL